MAKITFGEGYDDSQSSLTVHTDGGAGLEVNTGGRHDRARQDVVIDHVETTAASGSRKSQSDGGRVWAVGSFFLVALVVVAAVFRIVATGVSPLLVPIVIGAALLCFYLVALLLVPRSNARGVDGFQKVLTGYLKLILGKTSPTDSQ